MLNNSFFNYFSENQLVIVGGNDNPLSSVEVLDENKRLSCNIPSYPLKVKEHSSTVTSSGILVCGGRERIGNTDKITENCYEYRSVSNSWVKMPWIPVTRRQFDMIYLKGKVWAVGGNLGDGSSQTMNIIDYNTSTSTRQWIPVPTFNHCLAKLSPNQFILIGGNQGYRVSKNVMKKIFQNVFHLSNQRIFLKFFLVVMIQCIV